MVNIEAEIHILSIQIFHRAGQEILCRVDGEGEEPRCVNMFIWVQHMLL